MPWPPLSTPTDAAFSARLPLEDREINVIAPAPTTSDKETPRRLATICITDARRDWTHKHPHWHLVNHKLQQQEHINPILTHSCTFRLTSMQQVYAQPITGKALQLNNGILAPGYHSFMTTTTTNTHQPHPHALLYLQINIHATGSCTINHLLCNCEQFQLNNTTECHCPDWQISQ
mmetsp:Transcript_41845/g.67150  ORF Transcript_41845/g.67150 Transcript_41845/m.67150 type:complete len:176 (+) Transcript_41845:1248-1775(+)